MTSSTITTRAPLLGEPLPVELMNTIWADRAGVHDALSTNRELLAWVEAIHPRLAGAAAFGDGAPTGDEASADRELIAEPAGGWSTALARAGDLQGLRELRDAMRRLTATRTGDTRPGAASAIPEPEHALDVLNRIAATSPSWVSLERQAHEAIGEHLRRVRHLGDPTGSGLASLIATRFIDMGAADGGPQLRACLAPGCVLYFAKVHNRREWCSPACGNRARAARHYKRRKQADS